jgi:hypothetical protein
MTKMEPMGTPKRGAMPPPPPPRDEDAFERERTEDPPGWNIGAEQTSVLGNAFTAAFAAAAARAATLRQNTQRVIAALSVAVRRPAYWAAGGTGSMPVPPMALDVRITGTTNVGDTLTGNYTYNDINNDAEGASTFKWKRDGVDIAAATAKTYVLTAGDAGHSLVFVVTPVSSVAPTAGQPAASAPLAIPLAVAPVALTPAISGTAKTGQTLTGSYGYYDANGNAEGVSTFQWYRDGAAIAGATAKTHVCVVADEHHVIQFEVVPVSTVAPTTGVAARSPSVTPIP